MGEIVVAKWEKQSIIPGHTGRNLYTGSCSMTVSETVGDGGKCTMCNMTKAKMAGIDFQHGSVYQRFPPQAHRLGGWGV